MLGNSAEDTGTAVSLPHIHERPLDMWLNSPSFSCTTRMKQRTWIERTYALSLHAQMATKMVHGESAQVPSVNILCFILAVQQNATYTVCRPEINCKQ